jgi:hypothetical protein
MARYCRDFRRLVQAWWEGQKEAIEDGENGGDCGELNYADLRRVPWVGSFGRGALGRGFDDLALDAVECTESGCECNAVTTALCTKHCGLPATFLFNKHAGRYGRGAAAPSFACASDGTTVVCRYCRADRTRRKRDNLRPCKICKIFARYCHSPGVRGHLAKSLVLSRMPSRQSLIGQ